jgi:glucan exporter ATP-binding protein
MYFLRIYGRVLGLLKEERWLAILLAVANVVVAGMQFLEPILFGRVVDTLTGSAGRSPDRLWEDALNLLGIWAVVGATGIAANIVVSLQADRMAHRRRLRALQLYFEHVLALSFAFHRETHSGRLLKIMLTGVDHMWGLWLSFFREQIATFVALFVMLPLAMFMNWKLALLLVALIGFFGVVNVFIVSRTHRLQATVEDYHSELAGRAGDAFGNVHLIQSFVRLSAETQHIAEVMQRTLQAQFPVLNWWALMSVLTRTAATTTVIATFILGTFLHLRGEATVGDIVSFMGFATVLIGRMEQASGFVSRVFFELPAIADFFRVLDTQSGVRDKPGARDIGTASGAVSFEGVSFSYDGKRTALKDFTLDVAPGTTVALVGPTGAGKSTTLSLLHRMYDPQSGTIRIDGVPHVDITVESLRRNIGVVFQDNTMFFRTIAENLRVGKPDASQAELEAACKLAEAHDFVERLPRGYDTMIGERGATLSGGERQRLSIARALLKNPPILILDEATSALDAVTEARIQQALSRLMHGRTTFVIAHRLSTIRDAAVIVVFERGEVVEQGSFDELMARDGAFARLVRTQQAGITAAPAAVAEPGG